MKLTPYKTYAKLQGVHVKHVFPVFKMGTRKIVHYGCCATFSFKALLSVS